jgi:hypothetical protein
MQNKKTFAFQLASTQKADTKTDASTEQKTWQVRDGVAVAGCTDPSGEGDYRYNSTRYGRDRGVWC